jgi:hypothetical protein
MIRKGKRTKPSCPGCGSSDLARIMYGLPIESAALTKAIERGEVALGGCCVSGDDPEWRCNACHTDFSPATRRSRRRKVGPR